MRRFRHLFALLFIFSIAVGVVHELTHLHPHGETCEVCILAHSPALVDALPALPNIDYTFEPFLTRYTAHSAIPVIPGRSRSPPFA